MERIQSAIAKARAEREALGQAPAAAPTSPPSLGAQAHPLSGPIPSPAGARSAATVEARWAALPEFTPDPERLAQNRILARPGEGDVTSFDVLRTKVLQQAKANGWRRIAITSPTPGCGKSTVALNLGYSLSRQSENRTLLLELDLRRPSLQSMLGIGERRSLAAVLQGEASFADCAQRLGPGFALATNGRAARNPAELLHSERMSRLVADIEAAYEPDLMLFDLPPVLVTDDALAFIGNVDAVLLIAAAETTSVKEIDHCERELASQSNVMGVVLNKCRHMGREYGYGYGHY